MDKDIRAALFDGFDDEGEFEELQDDFITQVLCRDAHSQLFCPTQHALICRGVLSLSTN